MIRINHKQLDDFEHVYRINLVNSCSGYKSANLIGTKSESGIENVAVFSSVTHMGSNPPLMGFFCRPTTVSRNTYDNIKATGYYTVNHIHNAILGDAHHTSAKYDATISEFNKTKLESDYKNDFFAPFLKNAPLQMAMRYKEEYLIKANETILVVGAVEDIYIDEVMLENDGFINLSKGNVAAINGLDGYSIPEASIRFPYQRPR